MQIKNTPHAGWKNNLQISNDHVELVISLDVGPRILSYKTPHGSNVLKSYVEQCGGSGEPHWMIRGGHRLWLAPEQKPLTYLPDNDAVDHKILPPHGVHLTNAGMPPCNVKKELTVTLAENTSEVTIVHKATNEGKETIEIATWGLSVMTPGGMAIIPQPPLGEHPRDLLPNRSMVLWPYTDLTDPRYRFGNRFITLLQMPHASATKLGLAHKERWIGYLAKDALFIKTFDYIEGEVYPDLGCNFETFTNSDMIELESLSPLRKLKPGESVSHTERWYLLGGVSKPHSLQESDLDAWVEPHLRAVGVI